MRTIEIHQPELEALIHQELASGPFHSVEGVLRYALKISVQEDNGSSSSRSTRRNEYGSTTKELS